MILDTAEICDIDNIASARLSMGTDGGNKLALAFARFAPAWANYLEPVTLIHRGRVIFHGKITSVKNSNDGGVISANVEVEDAIALLNDTTLPEQTAAVRSATGVFIPAEERRTLRGAAAKLTFSKLAGVRISASGWAARGTGGSVALVLSDKLLSRRCLTTRRISGGSSTLKTRLDSLRAANRDLVVLVDYATGNIILRTLGEGDPLLIDSATQRLYAVSGMHPQYDNTVTAAHVAVTDNRGGIMRAATYPDYMPAGGTGAKVYKVTASANVQPAVWDDVARQLYDAANAPTWGGTIRMRADDLDADPLGRRVCLAGPGMHPDWADMAALVTGTAWDLMSDTVDMTLGAPDGSNDNSDPTELDDESSNGDDTWDDDSTVDDTTDADSTTYGEPDTMDGDTTTDDGTPPSTPSSTPSQSPSTPSQSPSTPSQSPSSTTTDTHTQDECCPWCSQKIAELTQRIEALEARPQYTFAAPYLTVSADNVVSVSEDAMAAAANAAADAMELDLHVEGLVETTFKGDLTATLNHSGSTVSPTLDSGVSY